MATDAERGCHPVLGEAMTIRVQDDAVTWVAAHPKRFFHAGSARDAYVSAVQNTFLEWTEYPATFVRPDCEKGANASSDQPIGFGAGV